MTEEEKNKWKVSHHIIASEIQIPIFEEYFQQFDLKIIHINNMILHIKKEQRWWNLNISLWIFMIFLEIAFIGARINNWI